VHRAGAGQGSPGARRGGQAGRPGGAGGRAARRCEPASCGAGRIV